MEKRGELTGILKNDKERTRKTLDNTRLTIMKKEQGQKIKLIKERYTTKLAYEVKQEVNRIQHNKCSLTLSLSEILNTERKNI